MIEFADSLIDSGLALARAAMVLIAVVTVAGVWWRTKALIPVVSAVIVAAIALWATSPAGVSWLKDRIESDTVSLSAPDGP
jgi:uncharacterized membrane protein YesL